MKVGFDYWQVISHYPDQIYELIASLENNANDTHIISAIGKTRIGTIPDEVSKLYPNFSKGYLKNCVHEVVFKKSRESPELKLAKCKELGIQMFFDDRKDVCDLLNANGILAFQVPRRDANLTDLQGERK